MTTTLERRHSAPAATRRTTSGIPRYAPFSERLFAKWSEIAAALVGAMS